jgi:hypothetical protein
VTARSVLRLPRHAQHLLFSLPDATSSRSSLYMASIAMTEYLRYLQSSSTVPARYRSHLTSGTRHSVTMLASLNSTI